MRHTLRKASGSYHSPLPNAKGFPLSSDDLQKLKAIAAQVARPFMSRLIAADLVRDVEGQCHFLEAGPGAVAGTSHELVFKYVANRLVDKGFDLSENDVGGFL